MVPIDSCLNGPMGGDTVRRCGLVRGTVSLWETGFEVS